MATIEVKRRRVCDTSGLILDAPNFAAAVNSAFSGGQVAKPVALQFICADPHRQ